MNAPGTTGKNLTGLTFDQLQDWVVNGLGMRPFRASQLFRWIHLRRVASMGDMTDISREARDRLTAEARLTVLHPVSELTATDGTIKHVFGLEDGALTEAVRIPDPPRLTACLSTQAGCRMGCAFCATGRMGFTRDLEPEEIVAQLYSLSYAPGGGRITNVVLMGMGEPMDNFDAVSSALSIISDDRGICIGARKITVSTVGVPGGIDRMSSLPGQYGLALSLHSAIERTRRSLVPAARALPLAELKRELLRYAELKGRRITLEYCLIRDINDSIEEADALARFAHGIPCKINLILFNPVPGSDFRRPRERSVKAFMAHLYPRCPAVTLRRSRGAEIAAACGQLASETI